MSDKLKDILNPPVRGGVKRIKKVLDRYIIDKKEKKEVLKEIVNLGQNNTITPRCFILDTNNIVCSPGFIELAFGHVNPAQYSNTNNVIMFIDPNDCIDNNENICDVDTWVSVNKEHIVAEISYKEFLGNKVDGYFSKIRLIHPGSTDNYIVESPYFLDDFSKQRINYLFNNPDKAKYNFISLTHPGAERPDYACMKYVMPFGEYIRIGIIKTPFLGDVTDIVIPFNAEVLPQ